MTEGFLTRNVCFPAYRLSPEVPEHTTNDNNNDCRPPELSLVAPFLDFFFFLFLKSPERAFRHGLVCVCFLCFVLLVFRLPCHVLTRKPCAKCEVISGTVEGEGLRVCVCET